MWWVKIGKKAKLVFKIPQKGERGDRGKDEAAGMSASV